MLRARSPLPGREGRRRSRISRVLPGLLLVAVVPVLVPPGAASAADDGTGTGTDSAAEADATPLVVELRTLTPAVVPVRGPLLMTGTVTNGSSDSWEDVNVAPFVGDTALTTRDELEAASQTPEETEVGARLSEPGTFAAVGDLGPGESADFAVSVPREELPSDAAPGVYWIGVHALGTDEDGRDSVADGRARTFVTLPPRGEAAAGSAQLPEVPVSLVVPLQQSALRAADGSLADPEGWVDTVGQDGRLDRVSRFAESAGTRPLGWLVDPAVLDALDDLGAGDPSLSLGPADPGGPGDPTESPGPASSSGSASPSDQPSEDTAGADGEASDAPGAADARALTARVEARWATDRVLATPYADTDTVSLLRRAPGLLERALSLGRDAFDRRGLAAEQVLATPSGRVDPGLVDQLPDGLGLVLSDRGDLDVPAAGTLDDHPVLVADARASAGGPGPTPALDALALRQRLLAETSLERQRLATSGSSGPRPVVVVLPRDWDPGPDWEAADLFGALDVPWLRWAPPPTATDPLDLDLDYPSAVQRREIGDDQLAAARGLVDVATALDDLLTNDNDVRPRLVGAALQAVSYDARTRREETAEAVEALTATVQRSLDRVGVFGSEFVTLSGGSGTLTVTVVNDLAQPVEVAVDVRADAGVRVERIDPVALGPEQRVTVRVPVTSDTGIHDVTLVPVTTSGVPAGATFDFVLRTSQVGVAIWVVMGAAGLLFLVSLLRRLRRRLREGGRLRTRGDRIHDPQPEEAR